MHATNPGKRDGDAAAAVPMHSVSGREGGGYLMAAWLLAWLGSIFRANVWLQVLVFDYREVASWK